MANDVTPYSLEFLLLPNSLPSQVTVRSAFSLLVYKKKKISGLLRRGTHMTGQLWRVLFAILKLDDHFSWQLQLVSLYHVVLWVIHRRKVEGYRAAICFPPLHYVSIFCLTKILAVTLILHCLIHIRTLLTLTHLTAHAIIGFPQLCIELLKQTHLVLVIVSSASWLARWVEMETNAWLVHHKVDAGGHRRRLRTIII